MRFQSGEPFPVLLRDRRGWLVVSAAVSVGKYALSPGMRRLRVTSRRGNQRCWPDMQLASFPRFRTGALPLSAIPGRPRSTSASTHSTTFPRSATITALTSSTRSAITSEQPRPASLDRRPWRGREVRRPHRTGGRSSSAYYCVRLSSDAQQRPLRGSRRSVRQLRLVLCSASVVVRFGQRNCRAGLGKRPLRWIASLQWSNSPVSGPADCSWLLLSTGSLLWVRSGSPDDLLAVAEVVGLHQIRSIALPG